MWFISPSKTLYLREENSEIKLSILHSKIDQVPHTVYDEEDGTYM